MGSTGPGPAYALPPTIGYDKHDQRKFRHPQFSIGGRLKERIVSITPGPNINTQGFTQHGRKVSHAYSIVARNFEKDPPKIGPGPAIYDLGLKPYVSKPAPPLYSLGRPNTFQFKHLCPGPNVYAIKDDKVKKSSPAFVLAGRAEIKPPPGSPGPANYGASHLRITMPKAPEYSLRGPRKHIVDSFAPGANVYDRTNYKPGKSPPSYSFGVRHSDKSPPMIVPCDKVKSL